MNAKKLLTVSVTVAITTMFALASNFTALSINEMSITALAQVPPAPFLPNGGDLNTDNQLPDTNTQSQSQPPQPPTPAATNTPPPTIQITSHQDGSQVPVGELTIQGTSSDNQESNCQVYADVNDIAPLQNATDAAGINGGDDYSQWTFTYTQDYQVISQGVNELTAKISCFDDGGGSITAIPLSEWYSVNVTGVAGGATTTPTTTPTPTITPSPSPVPSPTMTQAPSASALGAEQGSTNIPSTIASPPSSFATPEGPSTGSNQGGSGGGDGDDDDDDDDDNGDDDGEDEGDDDDEGDDG